MNSDDSTIPPVPAAPVPWRDLRRFTDARIALGRTGGSLPTGAVLDFRQAHACARDAVHTPFPAGEFALRLAALTGWETLTAASAARDRQEYLRRPDLGRTLYAASRADLLTTAAGRPPCDLLLGISDGLSAEATLRQVPPLLEALFPLLQSAGWNIGPLVVIRGGRVALLDEIAPIFRASISLILLGERPGLGSADSLGAYLTFAPGPGRTDADRNCVSNIRPAGLPPDAAARKIFWLLQTARQLQLSGVALKDGSDTSTESLPPTAGN